MSVISLDQLTILGVRPAELVELAAAAAYGAISPFIGVGNSELPMTPLRAGHPDTLAMRQRMAQTGVVPGEGDLPVAEFLATLPPHVIFGLEVPLRSMAEQGGPPTEELREP
jgi:hypothetical protein